MFEHRTKLRVRYSEVDRMGYVYHGNYAQYYEIGRVEAMRAFGLSYAEMEAQGIMMPVVKMESNFRKPAYYDQELTVITRIHALPRARVDFHYEIQDSNGELLNAGMTQLVFVDSQTMRPMRAPTFFVDALRPFISNT
jgi:acyl-CoA thioester hydrolase